MTTKTIHRKKQPSTPRTPATLFVPPERGEDHFAVLGPNRGNPVSAYRHGYFEAVRALLESRRSPDTMLYPIVFLFRHAVELSLKQLAVDLSFYAGIDYRPPKNHDVAKLWKRVVKLVPDCIIDRYPSSEWGNVDIADVDAIITELVDFDPGGVSFRYAADEHGRHEHPALPTVSYKALTDAMWKVEHALTSWIHFIAEDVRYIHERRAARGQRKGRVHRVSRNRKPTPPPAYPAQRVK